jgi:hypothetical protein
MFDTDAKKYCKPILYGVGAAYALSLLVAFLVALLSGADWIVALGAFWLGTLLGTLLGYYLQEAEEWDSRALGASIWIAAGSSILVLLQFLAPKAGAREVWFYPIGLVGGFIVGTIWECTVRSPQEGAG